MLSGCELREATHRTRDVRNVRHSIGLQRPSRLEPGELTVTQVAARLDVVPGTVYYWIRTGLPLFARTPPARSASPSPRRSKPPSEPDAPTGRAHNNKGSWRCSLMAHRSRLQNRLGARLKRSGMHWTTTGATAIATLRCQHASRPSNQATAA